MVGEVCLKTTLVPNFLPTINHLNLKLLIYVSMLQVLKFEFLKFRIFDILNFHPWKKKSVEKFRRLTITILHSNVY